MKFRKWTHYESVNHQRSDQMKLIQRLESEDIIRSKYEADESLKELWILKERPIVAVWNNAPQIVKLNETKEQTLRTIKPWDNLYNLAKEYKISIKELIELNKDSPKYKQYKENPKLIQVGDVLVVPNPKATESSITLDQRKPEHFIPVSTEGGRPDHYIPVGVVDNQSTDNAVTTSDGKPVVSSSGINITQGDPSDNTMYWGR